MLEGLEQCFRVHRSIPLELIAGDLHHNLQGLRSCRNTAVECSAELGSALCLMQLREERNCDC